VKTASDALGVSRSQLNARLKGSGKASGRDRKVDGSELLAEIRTLTDDRPTYGYRRVGALLNRARKAKERPTVDHKRVYPLMAQNGLLLPRYTGKPLGKAHDGQVITIRPNLLWTSDGFEIRCWNGEVVRVSFALDTCDREAMAYCVTDGGITREMIRDLMLESV